MSKNKIGALVKGLSIFGAIIAVGVIGAVTFREHGRRSLYQQTESTSMTIELEEAGDQYQEGDVLYNDEVYRYNEDILTFLLMGIDNDNKVPDPRYTRDYTKGGQADGLFLVVVNPHSKEISLVNINRNAMTNVDIYSKDGQYLATKLQQICLQHGYGSGGTDSCERQVKAVSELFFKQPIYGYAAINIGAVAAVNDVIGGVEVELLERIPSGNGSYLLRQPLGTPVTLKGKDAQHYVRYRDINNPDSVMMRLRRQKQYLEAFAQKAMSLLKQDLSIINKLYKAASKYLVTDVDLAKATYLASELLGYSFPEENSYVLEGEMVIGPDGFEEFYVDDAALYDLMIQLFYEKVH